MSKVKGTRTEKNLLKAFAGESQARNRYTFFASVAKKEGYEQIAGIFLETADNNVLLSNEANNNNENGIHLLNSDGNTIMSNTANNNNNGTFLETSDYNLVYDNTFLGNAVCYNETGSIGNVFRNNICTSPGTPAVAPLDDFILGLIIDNINNN